MEVPKSVTQAYALDEKNGDTLWADTITKEIKDISPAFRKLDSGDIFPIGCQRVNFHMIFDFKMDDFRRKARLVAGGHMTEPPSTITYTSVVYREKFSISFTLATLNGFPVKVSDIKNAYITAPATEKIWTVLGPKFDEYFGRKAIEARALYGLKSAGAAFFNY